MLFILFCEEDKRENEISTERKRLCWVSNINTSSRAKRHVLIADVDICERPKGLGRSGKILLSPAKHSARERQPANDKNITTHVSQCTQTNDSEVKESHLLFFNPSPFYPFFLEEHLTKLWLKGLLSAGIQRPAKHYGALNSLIQMLNKTET